MLVDKIQISSWLLDNNINNYQINEDFSVDVGGDVDIRYKSLLSLPVQFGCVSGTFDCSYNELKYLDGSPKRVGGNFFCNSNKIVCLHCMPLFVGVSVNSSSNLLTSLDSNISEVKGETYHICSCGKLIYISKNFLNVGYREICDSFYCHGNELLGVDNGIDSLGGYIYIRQDKRLEGFDLMSRETYVKVTLKDLEMFKLKQKLNNFLPDKEKIKSGKL